MTQQVADHSVPLSGVPEGIAAFPLQTIRADGVVVRTRRGRAKLEVVELRPRKVKTELAPFDELGAEFVLGATRRRWSTIEAEFGDDAWNAALRLVRAGAVTLRCCVDGATRLGAPIAWILTESWA